VGGRGGHVFVMLSWKNHFPSAPLERGGRTWIACGEGRSFREVTEEETTFMLPLFGMGGVSVRVARVRLAATAAGLASSAGFLGRTEVFISGEPPRTWIEDDERPVDLRWGMAYEELPSRHDLGRWWDQGASMTKKTRGVRYWVIPHRRLSRELRDQLEVLDVMSS